MSDLTDKQLQDNITATEMQFNNAKKSNKPEDKIKASKLKKRLDEMIKEQTDRKKGNKGGKSQATASLKSQRVDQKKNNAVPVKKYKCKFKATDKILVVSVDDLDNVEHMDPLITYLRSSNIPVTLFPHFKADQSILKEMRALPNAKLGWHGYYKHKLDANPLAGTDKSVIAWSYGQDSEGRKKKLGKGTVARGTKGNMENKIGKLDQHDLPSLSLRNVTNEYLKIRRNQVLNNGGVLSVYMHHAGKEIEKKVGKKTIKIRVALEELKETVTAFKDIGGKIVHMEQLKGCGK